MEVIWPTTISELSKAIYFQALIEPAKRREDKVKSKKKKVKMGNA